MRKVQTMTGSRSCSVSRWGSARYARWCREGQGLLPLNPPQSVVTQSSLKNLAGKHTKPLSLGPKFTPSAATKTLADMAKHGRDPQLWKQYRQALRKDKEQWTAARLDRACEDWATYKSLTRGRRGWGEEYIVRTSDGHPIEAVTAHFEQVFHNDDRAGDMQEMESLRQAIDTSGGAVAFTPAEVAEALAKGKRGKAVGADQVPTELLQGLARNEESLQALTCFYNEILLTGEIPSDWDRSVATLLPKVVPPSCPKELRPIALASHVSKCFARLVLKRLEECLQVTGYKQCAAKGRQPADFLWTAIYMMQLSKEWKSDSYILKLDLKRAFDSVFRSRLARKIAGWCGPRFPFETKCLIRMLMSREVVLALPWLDYQIDANIGVKQGATESPALFAKLLDTLLHEIQHEHVSPVLEALPVDGNCYMDDVLAWKASISGLQSLLDALLPALSYYGLEVQPLKCQLLCVQGPRDRPLLLSGQKLFPLKLGDPLYVMNLPLHVDATETRMMEALIDKARKKYFGILHTLTSSAPLSKRLQLLNTVVFGVFRWILGVTFPSNAVQGMLNHFQFNCVRRMANLKRRGGGLWVEAETRTLRVARALIHKHEGRRWGDRHLEAYWDFLGHRVREGHRECPSAAGILSHFRGLGWWQAQQGIASGKRHGRHFPHLMNCERRVAESAGGVDWRNVAGDRANWYRDGCPRCRG